MCIDPTKTYTAVVETNMGEFTIKLDPTIAPQTVNNFVYLARYHFYDGLIFHRVIKDFMMQGGDPEGSGTGGPGYEFADELPRRGQYQLYSVAMANAGPDTNGSQFFIITGRQGVELDPNYSLFGQVTSGTDVIDKIGVVPTDSRDKPVDDVVMTKVTIDES
jgi:cyclophilin family peptidyl-prolyl cis-trans isomerase